MDLNEKIARYQEIERRGLLDRLPPEKQAVWAEIKRRGLVNAEPQKQYTPLEKTAYTLRGAGEGLTFGLGDIVAGMTNVPMNYLAGNFESPVKLFKEGRKDFVNEQEQFAKEYPALNFAGELGGGLVTGALGVGKNIAKTGVQQGLKALAKTGAKEGAKFGAAYGAGSGLTSDADKLSISNALLGAGMGLPTGAALGAALPVGIAGVGKGAGKVIKGIDYLKNKEINTINKVAGADVAKSIQEGRPLIDLANESTLDLALGTKQADPRASQVYVDYARQRLQGQRPKINQMLKYTFGEKGSSQLLDELNQETLKGSRKLYDNAIYQLGKDGQYLLDNAGRKVGKVLPELEKLNKYELDYIGKVYRTKGLEYDVQGLPQNDMRVLNYAKQLMDDDIQRLTNQGQNAQARILAEKRAAFIDKIDKANPAYQRARAFYERGKQAEDALQLGRNFDKGRRENKLFEFNNLTPEQQAFYRLGIGDRIAEHTNVKTEGGNIAQRVFDAETNRRLNLFGIKDAAKLIEQAKKESITAANLQRLLQGSQTAEKQASVGRWATNPTRQEKWLIARIIDNLYGKIVNPNAESVAKALTDPQYLAQILERAKTNTVGAQYKAAAGNISQILNDATKPIKNKGGFVRIKDLTEHYDNFSKVPKEKRRTILKNRIDKIKNKPIETDTKPLKVQITDKNEEHLIKSNLPLTKTQELRHQSALLPIKEIINKSKQDLSKSGKVDLTHNAPKTAQRKAEEVSKYVYFNRPVKIGNENFTVKLSAEQLKKQDPDLLNLYHINVKRDVNPTQSALGSNISLNNSITQKKQNVKGSKNPKINDILKEAK